MSSATPERGRRTPSSSPTKDDAGDDDADILFKSPVRESALPPDERKAELRPDPRSESARLADRFVKPDELRALSRRDNTAGKRQLMGYSVLVLALMVGNVGFGSNVCVAAQAFVMAFLFHGLHELVHRTVFEGDLLWLNDAAANVFGFLCFRPPKHYRFMHYNHHKFTGDSERDPELQESLVDMRLDSLWKYALYMTSVPFWFDRLLTVFRHGVLEWVVPREHGFLTKNTRPLMLREAWHFVVAYSVVIGAACALRFAVPLLHDVVVWGWLVPVVIGQPVLRFYVLAEHIGCPGGADMLANSRTTDTYAWFAWLAWQMPFHAEHHAYPTVPFHRLPELHALLRKRGAYKQEDTSSPGGAARCIPTGSAGYIGLHVVLLRNMMGHGNASSRAHHD